MSTSGTPSVCILGVHRGRTLTALFIFSVPRWPKKVLIYSRTVNNHGNTSRRPSMSVCVYIHTTCIHCFMERLEKMVDSLSHLFFSASSSNIKDREKKNPKYIYLSSQTVRQNQSKVGSHCSYGCTALPTCLPRPAKPSCRILHNPNSNAAIPYPHLQGQQHFLAFV